MPNGGKLAIKTKIFMSGEQAAAAAPHEGPLGYVRLAVTDTGEGMLPDIQERVFEPFFTTQGLAEHSGPGLSMVQGFVNQSGGYVNIQSDPGQGATVSLYLPCVLK